jgi:hypothetical protein
MQPSAIKGLDSSEAFKEGRVLLGLGEATFLNVARHRRDIYVHVLKCRVYL